MKWMLWVSLVFIVYVYGGYPLLIALLARFKPEKKASSGFYPKLSLIVAAYNEEQVIRKKIENTQQLNYPSDRLQIIIAADGSDDRTVDIVKEYSADNQIVLSYSTQRRGKMAAINRAIQKVGGDILVFSDANNFFEEETLHNLVPWFSDVEIGAVSGAKHVYQEDALSASEGLYWQYESWIKRNESRFHICAAAAGEILAVRENLFEPPPDWVINDDFYMLTSILKQGYRVVYKPSAQSWERTAPSAKEEMNRRRRISAGRFQALFNSVQWMPWKDPLAVWQIVSHKYLRLFLPLAMLTFVISDVFLVLSRRGTGESLFTNDQIYSFLLLGQLIFYAVAILGRFCKFKGVSRIFYLPVFLLDSNFAVLQGLIEFLSKGQRTGWEKIARRGLD